MTFIVPPFYDVTSLEETDVDSYTPRGSSNENDCSTPQQALELCFSNNSCEDGCDLYLSSTMAADCTAVWTWTCVLTTRCVVCENEIFNVLTCWNVVEMCGFTTCQNQPLPPILSGYANKNNNAPPTMEPVASPTMNDASEPTPSSPSSPNDGTYSPSLLGTLEIPFTSLATSATCSMNSHGMNHGWVVLLASVLVLVVGTFR